MILRYRGYIWHKWLVPLYFFGNLLFEKMESLEIHFEKIKILFSLQNLLKVLAFAVILRPWSLESVHGARRTVHLKFWNWAMHGYSNFLPSFAKEGRKLEYPCMAQFQNFKWTVLRAPWTDSNDQGRKMTAKASTFRRFWRENKILIFSKCISRLSIFSNNKFPKKYKGTNHLCQIYPRYRKITDTLFGKTFILY